MVLLDRGLGRDRQRMTLAAASAAVALLAGSGALLAVPPPAAEGTLVVQVDGLRSNKGQVAMAVYDSAESFRKKGEPVARAFVPIAQRQCEWTVEGLSHGTYAVKLFHDLNGNRKLDKNGLGIPVEPYGFSRDARGKFGPPGFKKARFDFDQERHLVRIRVE